MKALVRLILFVCSLHGLLLAAQQQAPAPSGLASGKTIFIGNSGEDAFADNAEANGVPSGVYRRVYAAMAAWGRYKLVSSPSEADIVLEVGSHFVGEDHTALPFAARRITFAILDRPTNIQLWGGTIHVARAVRQHTLAGNLDSAVTSLVESLKRLSAPGATTP